MSPDSIDDRWAQPRGGDSAVILADLATELASPVRVRILTHLLTEGPSRVREISLTLGISDSMLSNHLARLRQRSFVTVRREGRSAVYELGSPMIQELLAGMYGAISHSPVKQAHEQSTDPALVTARSCYDHLAGAIGVSLYEALLRVRAIKLDSSGDIAIGENAENIFVRLGIGLTAIPVDRRRLAYPCLDWTQGDYHLGGALGATMLTSFLDRRWLARVPGSRALTVTSDGQTQFESLFSEQDR